MRKYYLDHLRNLMILLLFPVHTLMIWNDYGSKFYVWGGENHLFSTIITFINPWFMPILFVIAGMSAYDSLQKRSIHQFIKERLSRLLLPFLAGILLLVPIQTWYARKFFFQYQDNYLEHLFYFFTHYTDLSGYDGCFTPGHLWFILYLFLISLLSCLFIKYISYEKMANQFRKIKIVPILFLFLLIWPCYYIGNFGGFSFGKCFILYLLGYYFFSHEWILEKLCQYRKVIFFLFLLLQLLLGVFYYLFSYYGDLLVNIVGWFGILSFLTLSKQHWNGKAKRDMICNESSYPIYLLHQSILVVLGYYILNSSIQNLYFQVLLIMLGSFLCTILVYFILSKIPYIRSLLGMRVKITIQQDR